MVLRGLFAYFSHNFRRVCMSLGAIHCLVLDIKGRGSVNNLLRKCIEKRAC